MGADVESAARPGLSASAMNRLLSELHRLYLPRTAAGIDTQALSAQLIDDNGMVRAMVMELARPADWEELAKVWRGVQTELEWPEPGVAVSGADALQLWFSLVEPIAVAQVQALLASLCARYLPDVATARLGLMPTWDATSGLSRHARLVPAQHDQTGYWSAFLSADLAPVFADSPWIESKPSSDAQAGVISRLASIAPPAVAAALARLTPAVAAPIGAAQDVAHNNLGSTPARMGPAAAGLDPRQFLRQVMNDDSAELALRIEAAKALLPYSNPIP